MALYSGYIRDLFGDILIEHMLGSAGLTTQTLGSNANDSEGNPLPPETRMNPLHA